MRYIFLVMVIFTIATANAETGPHRQALFGDWSRQVSASKTEVTFQVFTDSTYIANLYVWVADSRKDLGNLELCYLSYAGNIKKIYRARKPKFIGKNNEQSIRYKIVADLKTIDLLPHQKNDPRCDEFIKLERSDIEKYANQKRPQSFYLDQENPFGGEKKMTLMYVTYGGRKVQKLHLVRN